MTVHKPLHPGGIVKDILIDGAGLSVTDTASKLGVSRATISRLLNGHSGISSDMALRLSKLLPNTTVKFWMNLQRDYDIWQVQRQAKNVRIKPLDDVA